MLKKDVFCMTSDYDSTFSGDVVNKGKVFVCDSRNQYLWTQEHGVYFQNGYPLENEIYADMGEILAGKAASVREGRRTCLFMGIASHDVMTAKLILEKADKKNAGTMLKL
jgi:ornithine cyclodeaminase/alanine dehydrogenase